VTEERLDERDRVGVGVERNFAEGRRRHRLPAIVGDQRSHLCAAPALQEEDAKIIE